MIEPGAIVTWEGYAKLGAGLETKMLVQAREIMRVPYSCWFSLSGCPTQLASRLVMDVVDISGVGVGLSFLAEAQRKRPRNKNGL